MFGHDTIEQAPVRADHKADAASATYSNSLVFDRADEWPRNSILLLLRALFYRVCCQLDSQRSFMHIMVHGTCTIVT